MILWFNINKGNNDNDNNNNNNNNNDVIIIIMKMVIIIIMMIGTLTIETPSVSFLRQIYFNTAFLTYILL